MKSSMIPSDGSSLPVIDTNEIGTPTPEAFFGRMLKMAWTGRPIAWGVFRAINLSLKRLAPGAWRTLQGGREHLHSCNDTRVLGFRVQGHRGERWTITEYAVNNASPRGLERLGSVSLHDLWGWLRRDPGQGENARQVYLALKRSASAMGIAPTGYHSPGYYASAILGRSGARDHFPGDDWRETCGSLGGHAFHGGRVETRRFGHSDREVYVYDLNSAYPWALSFVPSLEHASLEECDPSGLYEGWALCIVEWNIKHRPYRDWPLGPFPVRNPSTGQTCYPSIGVGVYWSPIVDAALAEYPGGEVRILKSWRVVGDFGQVPLYDTMRRLYGVRQSIENPLDRMIAKSSMQAVWGRLCQSRGTPTWRCIEWAGMATSIVHAKIFGAAMRNPRAVWAFTNDGIICVGGQLPITPTAELGGWSVKRFKGIEYYRDGVYRVRREDGTWRCKSSGFIRRDFPWEEAGDLWRSVGPIGSVDSRWSEFTSYRSAASDDDWCSVSEKSVRVPLHPENRHGLTRQIWPNTFSGRYLHWKGAEPMAEFSARRDYECFLLYGGTQEVF